MYYKQCKIDKHELFVSMYEEGYSKINRIKIIYLKNFVYYHRNFYPDRRFKKYRFENKNLLKWSRCYRSKLRYFFNKYEKIGTEYLLPLYHKLNKKNFNENKLKI